MRSLQILILSLTALHALPVDDSRELDELNAGGSGGAVYGGGVGGPGPNPGPNPGNPWPGNWNPGYGGNGLGNNILGVLPAAPVQNQPTTIRFKLVWVEDEDSDVDEDDPVVKHYNGKEIIVVKPPAQQGGYGYGYQGQQGGGGGGGGAPAGGAPQFPWNGGPVWPGTGTGGGGAGGAGAKKYGAKKPQAG